MTPARARAVAVAAAARVSAGDVAVSWFAGASDAEVDRVDTYPLGALADDLRALVASVRPKGEGVALVGAALDGRRAIRRCARATLVHIDHDGAKHGGGATMGDAADLLAAMGVGAVLYPSPSSIGPARSALNWRALVHVADDVPRAGRLTPSSLAGRRALVALLRDALGAGGAIDAGPALDLVRLTYVHPAPSCVRCGHDHEADAHQPRGAGDVMHVIGDAFDLPLLAAAAVTRNVIAAFDATSDRSNATAYDLDAAREVWRAAGLVVRGDFAECPVAHEHSDTRGHGDDSSCVVGRRAIMCSHEHSNRAGAPRGVLRGRALVDLALQRVADVGERERLDAALHPADEGPAARVRRLLGASSAPPVGSPDLDVPEVMRDVGRWCSAQQAKRTPAAALLRCDPGAGKSSQIAHMIAAAVDLDAVAPRAVVACVLVDARARIPDVVRALHSVDARGRRALPVVVDVHRPVHAVTRDDGSPVCIHHAAAEQLAREGANARETLCRRGECPLAPTCEAARDYTPHDGARYRPDMAPDESPRVRVATHATGAGPDAGGLLVVDEAHASPWNLYDLNDDAADVALASAGHYAVTWFVDAQHAAVAAAVADAVRADPSALRSVVPAERPAWCAAAVLRHAPPRRLARAFGAAPTPADAERAAVSWGSTVGAFKVVHEKRGTHGGRVRAWASGDAGVAEGAGETLRALRAWIAGAAVEGIADERGGDVVGTSVSWPSPAVEAARATIAAGGAVVAMDATADDATARAVCGGAVRVFDARFPDRREVTRVVIAHTRSTSKSQLSREVGRGLGGRRAVRWDRVAAQIAAAGRRVAAWRTSTGREAVGGGLVRQPIARALRALWSLLDGDAADEAVAAACVDLVRHPERHTRALTSTRADLDALLADARALQRVADFRAVVPRMTWTYPGHPLARGSNELQRAGVNVLVALGDFRPPPHTAAAWAATTGRDRAEEASRLAGVELCQWWGRARVVRDGDPVLMVHVGEIPADDWRGREGVEVIESLAAPAEARDEEVDHEQPAAAPAAPKAAPSSAEGAAVVRLLAGGWSPMELARRLARALPGRNPESIARTLRRWRDDKGGDTRDAALRDALVAVAAEERDPADAVRARLVGGLLPGRGAARLWRGVNGAVGLRVYAERFGVAVALDDLAMFAGGAERPAVVDLLLRDCGTGAPVVAALEAAHGIAPHAPARVDHEAAERLRQWRADNAPRRTPSTHEAPAPPRLPAPPYPPQRSPAERARVNAAGVVEGSSWSRADALRLRPGVTRSARRGAEQAPPVEVDHHEAPRRRPKGAPPP